METTAQGVPGYFVWEIPGKPVAVHLQLDAVDRLLAEAIRGLSAIPKRGAEVGGILLGTIEEGNPAVVRVENFEPVECEYRRGPSYQFAGDEAAAFEEACARRQPSASGPVYAVGYFRSHTRDGLALAPEDLELLDRHFPAPSHIALLIRPYATKVSTAGLFFRENGAFPPVTPLEFPFRRREMTGEEAPPRRPLTERKPRMREMRPAAGESFAPEPSERHEPAYAIAPAAKPRVGRSWIPLSFISLLVGVVLGFQAAMIVGSRTSGGGDPRDVSLALSVAKTDDNLSVKWDRGATAIRTAQRGLLEIEDGGSTKSVDLDTSQLKNGSILYRNSSSTVRFRLVVYPAARVSVTETMEWRQ
jgi:hypothetical protein